ncbi:MAG: hypothetical protein U1F66_00350 [bacterium]
MELVDYVWNKLEPTEEAGVRKATAAGLEELYQKGFVDARRFSLPQWKNGCQKFSKSKGIFLFKRSDLDSLKNYLFQAQIKRPFEPHRLKDGLRPLEWTGELYQKVLRFETTLTLDAWKDLVKTQLLPKFQKGKNIIYNQQLKSYLEALLKQHASPLRRLELWYHFEREAEAPPPSEGEAAQTPVPKPAAPAPIKDAFVAKPDESLKRSAIDRLYFHHGETPPTSDQENLDFLDELAHLEDSEGEDEGP